MRKNNYHEPVLVREVTHALHIKKKGKYIDATVGSGGHSLEIVKAGAMVLGLDADSSILAIAKARLEEVCPEGTCLKLAHVNFRKIDEVAAKEGFEEVSGVLFDLGVANLHLEDEKRGFSFAHPEARLDMRLDPGSQAVTAADLLAALRPDQLRSLFEVTLDPGAALWLAKRVVLERRRAPIEKVGDFLAIFRDLRAKPGLNPATLPMLALRIAVGGELENLKEVLPKAFRLLEKKGRLVVISFHSGEDRLVKEFFKHMEGSGLAEIETKDAIVPTDREIKSNPRARSAKMRVLKKK